jgi:hypothetical protein
MTNLGLRTPNVGVRCEKTQIYHSREACGVLRVEAGRGGLGGGWRNSNLAYKPNKRKWKGRHGREQREEGGGEKGFLLRERNGVVLANTTSLIVQGQY